MQLVTRLEHFHKVYLTKIQQNQIRMPTNMRRNSEETKNHMLFGCLEKILRKRKMIPKKVIFLLWFVDFGLELEKENNKNEEEQKCS